MFFVMCRYKPDGDLERFKYRVEHLEYMIQALPIMRFGGPLMADDGDRSSGAIFVLDLPDRAGVERFLAEEPYNRNGIFESVQIHRLRQMVPEPEPGMLERELELERQRPEQGS